MSNACPPLVVVILIYHYLCQITYDPSDVAVNGTNAHLHPSVKVVNKKNVHPPRPSSAAVNVTYLVLCQSIPRDDSEDDDRLLSPSSVGHPPLSQFLIVMFSFEFRRRCWCRLNEAVKDNLSVQGPRILFPSQQFPFPTNHPSYTPSHSRSCEDIPLKILLNHNPLQYNDSSSPPKPSSTPPLFSSSLPTTPSYFVELRFLAEKCGLQCPIN